MKEEYGWIKLHRCIIDSPVFADEKTLKVWIWCLMKASYKERDVLIGTQVVHLKEGQFITGNHSASAALNISVMNYRTRINTLKKLGMISVKATNKFSIVTITNWEKYQQDKKRGSSQYGLGYYRGQQDAKNEKVKPSAETKVMLTIKEASEYSGVSYNAIRQMCLQDKIKYIKAGNKYLINKESFAEYLQTGDK